MNKRVLPRSFPLAGTDWVEIANCLDDVSGALRKLPPDGKGMAGNEKAQSKLSEKDWIEIYLSIESKLDAMKAGFYGRDHAAHEWAIHLREILRVLSLVKTTFIGGKPV